VISNFVTLFDMGQQNPASSTPAGIMRTPPAATKRLGQLVAFRTATGIQTGTIRGAGAGALFLRKV
jgi:hypothetical protein